MDLRAERCTSTNIDFVGALQMDPASPHGSEQAAARGWVKNSQLSLPISTFTASPVERTELRMQQKSQDLNKFHIKNLNPRFTAGTPVLAIMQIKA